MSPSLVNPASHTHSSSVPAPAVEWELGLQRTHSPDGEEYVSCMHIWMRPESTSQPNPLGQSLHSPATAIRPSEHEPAHSPALSLNRHTHSSSEAAPACFVVRFSPHDTHTPFSEYVPALHACMLFSSQPNPPGHRAHTLSVKPSSQGFTSISPDSHTPLQGLHSVIPVPDHSTPTTHIFFAAPHACPASHGQHTVGMVAVHSLTVYSPGGHAVQRVWRRMIVTLDINGCFFEAYLVTESTPIRGRMLI